MNWYKILKFAQIWTKNNSPYSRGFMDNLYFLYESEYKYSMLSQYPERFQGNPQRRENILKGFEENIRFLIEEVAAPISETFDQWLAEHALLSPRSWANQRLEETSKITNDCKGVMEEIQGEFGKYYGDFIGTISRNIDDYPTIRMILVDEREEYYQQRLEDLEEDPEYQMRDEAQRKEYFAEELGNISNMPFADLMDAYGCYDNDGFFEWASSVCGEYGNHFLSDIYMVLFVFWYEKWSAEGIDETREIIEKINSQLETLETLPIGQAVIVINSAIGAAHQTGDMVDYLPEHIEQEQDYANGDDISHLLSSLSNLSGSELEVWNEDLREVGFQI
jgi:hypothetical protein